MSEDNPKHDDTARPDTTSVAEGRLRRGLHWASEHRMSAGIVAGVLSVLIIGLAAMWLSLAGDSDEFTGPAGMTAALEALDEHDYASAREFAQQLRQSDRLAYADMGGPVFVLGVVASHEAEVKWGAEKVRYHALAAGFLEAAHDRGFPKGRAAEGLYLLGKNLFLSDRIPESRAILREALKQNRGRRTEIHRLLSKAYLQDANPKYPEALEHNTLYLADRALEPDGRLAGLVQRGQILLATGDIDECRRTLDELGLRAKTNSEALLLRGMLLMSQARSLEGNDSDTEIDPTVSPEAVKMYQQAIQLFSQSQGHDRLETQSTRKAYYLIGLARMEMGDHPAAIAQFARTRRVFPKSQEGFAAGLEEAELHRRMGHDKEALIGYRHTLTALGNPQAFSNPWISLDGLRQRLLAAYRNFIENGNYEQGVELASALDLLLPRTSALTLQAATYRDWGRAQLAIAEGADPTEAEAAKREGRRRLRQAGIVFSKLANLRITTRNYPDDIWESAESFLAGHDYVNAVRQFKRYLEIEGRRRRPRALVGLAETLLAQGKVDQSLESAIECIRSFPRDAASFNARLLAGKAYVEKADPDKAVELLLENIEGELLSPDSREWHQSLLDVGEILHYAGRHEEAIKRLSIAVNRWPKDSRTISAGYLLAESHRQHARALTGRLQNAVIPPERIAATREMGRMLKQALVTYGAVLARLEERRDKIELTEQELAMLRNCYFGRGAMLHELARYAEAIQAYTDATNRYQNDQEVLEAYFQISDSYRRLNQPDKARIALRQAQGVLKRIPNDAPFSEATNYTNTEWNEILDWMSAL